MFSPASPTAPGRPGIAGAALCLLGLVALVAAALDLSAHGLAHYLSSDFLTPYFFCADLLHGPYPLRGWTLSAAPYFVPDHLLLGSLLAIRGQNGFAYALYPPVYFTALAAVVAGCAHTVTGRTGPALAAGLLFGNALLTLRVLPGQAMRLWWIGAPTCHGGLLLLGGAYLWILGAGLRTGNVGRKPWALGAVGLVSVWSDSLFLCQILLPASMALFLLRRRHPASGRFLRGQLAAGAGALALAQIFKPLCQLNHWFYFSRVLRRAPTPANLARTWRQFAADVPKLLREDWMFVLLALAATIVLVRAWRHRRATDTTVGNTADAPRDFFRVFCVASLLIALPLPVLTCGWRSASNVRYLFNWLTLPGMLLTLELASKWTWPAGTPRRVNWRHACRAIAVLAAAGCLGGAVRNLRHEALDFPYPADVSRLDDILQRRGLRYGLAQYWDAKLVTALSHAGAELRQVRASGAEPYFWDNNACAYYACQRDGKFSWPAYGYVLTDLLDEPAVARAFGEPDAKEAAGDYRVWIYGDAGQRRIRATLEPKVQAKLGPRIKEMTFATGVPAE